MTQSARAREGEATAWAAIRKRLYTRTNRLPHSMWHPRDLPNSGNPMTSTSTPAPRQKSPRYPSVWTKAKKTTTKWNREAGANWMS